MSIDTSKIKKVKLVIYQPNSFTSEPAKEWECPDGYLTAFAEEAQLVIENCEQARKEHSALQSWQQAVKWEEKYLNPGEKQCQWCKAKAGCPAIAKECLQGLPDLTEGGDATNAIRVTTEDEFVTGVQSAITKVAELPLETLAGIAKVKGLFAQWLDAIDSRLFAELSAGNEVEGFKLVQGRGGHRKWVDEEEVEASMKAMRLKIDEMYQKKIISPTEAEKLLKKRPKLWNKLKDKIERSDGKPQIALSTDKRPAIDVQAKALEGLPDLSELEEVDDRIGGDPENMPPEALDFDLDNFDLDEFEL